MAHDHHDSDTDRDLRSDEGEGSVSRRGFLQTASLASAGILAGCATPVTPGPKAGSGAQPTAKQDRVLAGDTTVRFVLNGKQRKVQVQPQTTLAEALRGPLALTGTKTPCERGACGGCTVQLDGAAVNSCLLLAVEVEGRQVTTIEGLARRDGQGNEQLHPLQQAFIERDALQCGYCTPGMIMASKALLDATPKPTAAQIRDAVAGNLCRCGTYPHVFDAVALAAKRGG